jgi:SulP family sulfate permease
VLAFLAIGGSIIAILPLPALAGVTIYVGLCLLDWGTWRRLPKMRLSDRAAFVVTAVSILTLNAVVAVALGCMVYFLQYLRDLWVQRMPVVGWQPARD